VGAQGVGAPTVIDGITFAQHSGSLYAPLRETAKHLRMTLVWEEKPPLHQLDGKPLNRNAVRTLPTGQKVLPIRELAAYGVEVTWAKAQNAAQLRRNDSVLRVRWVDKRVAVNLKEQRLRAWEGRRLVLDTRISSGRPSHPTPRGTFAAGPLKSPQLISKKYHDAKMPWSIQVRGDVVIHGFSSVPPFAASHGCIRMPLWGYNPARWFYRWITIGTPIVIDNKWPTPKTQREQAPSR
jgi:hypothetical protein